VQSGSSRMKHVLADAHSGPSLSDFLEQGRGSEGAGGCGASGSGVALLPAASTRRRDAGVSSNHAAAAAFITEAAPSSGRHPPRMAYIETYGCQMNVSDSEIVAAVLQSANYVITDDLHDADAILLNTCAIRDGAEAKIWHRLKQLKAVKTTREKEARRAAKRLAGRGRVGKGGKGPGDSGGKSWGRSNVEVENENGVTDSSDAVLEGSGSSLSLGPSSGTSSDVPRLPPVVGILGCMGERLKEKLLETDGLADLVGASSTRCRRATRYQCKSYERDRSDCECDGGCECFICSHVCLKLPPSRRTVRSGGRTGRVPRPAPAHKRGAGQLDAVRPGRTTWRRRGRRR